MFFVTDVSRRKDINRCYIHFTLIFSLLCDIKYIMPEETRRKKRRHFRIPVTVLCDIFTLGSDKAFARGCIVNVSIGGIAVMTGADLVPDTRIRLRPEHENPKSFIHGEIVYRVRVMDDVYCYGIRFTSINIIKRILLKKKLLKYFREHKPAQA